MPSAVMLLALSAGAAAAAAAVVGEEAKIRAGDREVVCWIARPEGTGKVPALVIVHEWWGLNDSVKRAAEELAGDGRLVLAVDLFGGKVATAPEEARKLTGAVKEDEALATLRAAVAHLKKEPRASGKVGVLGWCFGGGWALKLALADPDVTATVVYYGRLESDPEKLKKLAGPVLGIFGAEDRNPSVEQVRAFEAGCKTAGVKCDVHVYEGAGHAFANPTNSRGFRPEAAKDARGKVREFLDRALK